MSDNVFVPDEGDRKGNAEYLVGSAEELGFDPRVVRAVDGGFIIPRGYYDALVKDSEGGPSAEPDDEPSAEPTKTSGNRAAKTTKTSSKKE